MKLCKSCGNQIKAVVNHCPHCGHNYAAQRGCMGCLFIIIAGLVTTGLLFIGGLW